AAREMLRIVIEPLTKTYPVEYFTGEPFGFRVVGQLQRQHHVLEGRVAGQELERLEHETDLHGAQPCARGLVQREEIRAVDLHPACSRRVEAGENREQPR